MSGGRAPFLSNPRFASRLPVMMTRRQLLAFVATATALGMGPGSMAAQEPKTAIVTLTIEGMT